MKIFTMKTAYLISGVRTPIGNFGGTLSPVRTDDLAALVLKELLIRNPSVDPTTITDSWLCESIRGR
jgi:acetyl-CoA acyltransferase